MNLVEPCDANLLMIKKKEQIADTYKTISKLIWLKKKSDIDEYVHYDSIYMKL